MEIKVDKKTRFIGDNPIVYDEKGLFYSRDGPCEFNLPTGDYVAENCEAAGKPLKYICPSLPWPQKFSLLPAFASIRIIAKDTVEDRPIGRAAIDTGTNKLYVNPDFMRTATTPEYLCTVAHELAHYFYDNEEYCDRYAMFTLIKYGLNPSQFISFINLLSDYSNERKLAAIEYAEKIHANTSSGLGRIFGL